MQYKLLFALLSLIPALFAYYYYFRDVLKGKTKPQTFSWLIWGILALNGFIGQLNAHAGFGAWITGLTATASLTVFCLALYKGDSHPTLFDWVLLVLSIIGFALLFIISNKKIALVITICALVAGFAITIRKAYNRPKEETAKSFLLNGIKFIPAIPALSTFNLLTLGYPSVALIGNFLVAGIIYYRRWKIFQT
jgi:hypothetical protein